MLPTSIGSQTGGIQPSVLVQKPETDQQFAEAEKAKAASPAPQNTSQPPVPATTGVSISVEAVTALQQVQEANTTEARNEVRRDDASNAQASVQQQQQSDQVTEQQATRSDQPVQQVTEDRYEARAEIASGEETDGAGRSARNPLNLQI
ncbi:hypothetical protein [Sneathiella aquimaris]|uniref:hypothetical protein n=1 Tax=Sneathiella aquimaris TaxID=2599305 RepID=UPI00146CC991|nr:hypothetical protein [Sneathiella aquimaris]